ncbi:hypothetical protein GHO27_28725, partial [Pseudomonas helleri]|nr:hypothetical protein [Pseudomonas helleri]
MPRPGRRSWLAFRRSRRGGQGDPLGAVVAGQMCDADSKLLEHADLRILAEFEAT